MSEYRTPEEDTIDVAGDDEPGEEGPPEPETAEQPEDQQAG